MTQSWNCFQKRDEFRVVFFAKASCLWFNERSVFAKQLGVGKINYVEQQIIKRLNLANVDAFKHVLDVPVIGNGFERIATLAVYRTDFAF